ncbi:hypothetical protein RhiirA5_463720 [Rhizophagus irregularis]|uniref:Uncharacterized protein n=2 Tax=Rhizophagus irregularis TaxID=588596 RepID=A0A2N0SHN3_9GLOM|nr:hypothetical protein RhiirA5_463720 [Rhizophagus irregularis]PKC75048.1 hypothetical protein RhiirA1_506941 [Rhizophagus irregularis]CAB5388044.1 unnamed protein product [Rhizophagus irregularis]
MPVKTKTRHNLNLCGYNFLANLSICRPADPNFKFKKRNPSHIFSEMACNGLHYGILSNYSDTYILSQARRNNSYVSRVVRPDDTNPTLRKCIYYISQLVINDNNVGNRLGHVVFDNDDDDDDDVMTIVMVTLMILMTPTTLDHLMMILVMIMVMMILQGRGREHQRPVVKKQLQVRPKELLITIIDEYIAGGPLEKFFLDIMIIKL